MRAVFSTLVVTLIMNFCAVAAAMPIAAASSGMAAATSTPPSSTAPWSAANDASPVFTPDGNIVVFTRGEGLSRRILVSHRHAGSWSMPERASFSGAWMDMEPAMAPDGSYLVFVSNRPATPGGTPLDGYFGGKSRPGRGGNLWRVNRVGHHWSAPVRLPDIINASPATYSPAVSADGSVYFMRPDPQSRHFRLYVSHLVHDRFQAPRPLSFSDGTTSDVDPAIAPDQSFIVFSSNRKPALPDAGDLFVAFATPAGWSQPIHLGPSGDEARLDPDLSTLYFSATSHHIQHMSIAPWLPRHTQRTR